MLTTNHQAAVDKLQALISQGQAGAANVIEHVMSHQPQDRIVKGGAAKFVPSYQDGKLIHVQTPDGVTHHIHRYALGQMAQVIDMPVKFLDTLQEEPKEWGRELLAHNFNTIYHERFGTKRFLARSVNAEVRGFLSDKYRRLDSRPIVEAFAQAVQEKGALPYSGVVTDTKIALRAVMPKVYEPIPGEVVAYGLSLENSDYGNGPLSVRAYLLRIWCDNLAVTEETMRQIHLGARLDENMIYSEKTYRLDTQTMVSALRDVTRLQLDAGSLDKRMTQVQAAGSQEVTAASARERLKRVLTKGEAEKAAEAFESPDVQNLPEGNTTWRLSNAISWIANAKDVAPERKLELGRIAGEVLAKAA